MARDAAEEMKARLRADLVTAMKERRSSEAKLIRALVAAIDNAEAPPRPESDKPAEGHNFRSGSAEVERLRLDRGRVREVLAAEIQEREHAAAEMERVGRADRAEALRAEVLATRRYLD
jgi:uncharacterized protein